MGNKEQLGMIRELAVALLGEVESLAGPESPAAAPPAGVEESDFYEMIRAYEKFLIRRALLRSRGNQAKAARMLGLKPTTLHNKIKVYDIKVGPGAVEVAGGAVTAGRTAPRAQTQGAA
ncbi:MAG TPA: helix-turn-helix domain-containing protein [Pyrinomonadaceae bacterium]|jgi:transcriptional regulator with GAF, ATPase, and Fis domain